jgi:hypothetical protein
MRTFLLTIIIFLLLSCGKTYRLSKTDVQFNPYKVGDTLIFQANSLLFDTVIVTKIVRLTVALGYPFSGNNDKGEGLSVIVDHKVSRPDSFPGRQTGSIFTIDNYRKGSYIQFWFTGHAKREAISNSLFARDLDTIKASFHSTKAGDFDDVIVIKADTVYPNIFDRLSKIYWSRQFGYIRLEVNEALLWELIKRLPAKSGQN